MALEFFFKNFCRKNRWPPLEKKAVFLGRVRPQLEAAAVDLQIDLQIQVGQADGIGILFQEFQKKQMAST